MNLPPLSAVAAASVILCGCATTAPNRQQIAGAAKGAVIGAGVGGLAGSVLPGIGTGAGMLVGSRLGSIVGVMVNRRQYYRDTRGYCYYVDESGQPQYSYDVRC